MRKSLFIFYIFFIPAVTFAAEGVDGCVIITGPTMQQRLYWLPYTQGNGSPTEWISNSSGGGGYNEVTPTKCFKGNGPSCKVYKFGTTGTTHTPTDLLYEGTYAIVVQCSLDDYVLILLIGAAGVGVFILRKRAFRVIS